MVNVKCNTSSNEIDFSDWNFDYGLLEDTIKTSLGEILSEVMNSDGIDITFVGHDEDPPAMHVCLNFLASEGNLGPIFKFNISSDILRQLDDLSDDFGSWLHDASAVVRSLRDLADTIEQKVGAKVA